MNIIRKNTRILFILIIPVYFFIVQNSILNKHTHFYPNGIVITHSHATNHEEGVPLNDHEHSETEICFYSLQEISFYLVSDIIQCNPISIGYDKHYVDFVKSEYSYSPFLKLVPRGPPSFFV